MIEVKDGKVYIAPNMYMQNANGTPMTLEEYQEYRRRK